MTDPELYTNWYIALAGAGAVVLIAAGLLIAVWMAARRILRLAGTALERVRQIKANTQSVWALEETNEAAAGLRDASASIRDHADGVARALHEMNGPPDPHSHS